MKAKSLIGPIMYFLIMIRKKELTEIELKNLISKTISTTIDKQGTYSKNIDSSIIITVGNVTLKDMEVNGNIIISENLDKKDINFHNIKVHGKIIANNANLHLREKIK